MHPLIYLITTLISLVTWALIIYVVISLLISFNILNRHQPIVSRVYYALGRLLEPMLQPIRNIMPDLGGIDIAPVLLIVLLNFAEYMVVYYAAQLM